MFKQINVFTATLLLTSFGVQAYNVDFEAMPNSTSYTSVGYYYPGVDISYPGWCTICREFYRVRDPEDPSGEIPDSLDDKYLGADQPVSGIIITGSIGGYPVGGDIEISFQLPQVDISLDVAVFHPHGNPPPLDLTALLICHLPNGQESVSTHFLSSYTFTYPAYPGVSVPGYKGTVQTGPGSECTHVTITFSDTSGGSLADIQSSQVDNLQTTGARGVHTDFGMLDDNGDASVTVEGDGTVDVRLTGASGIGTASVTTSTTPQQSLPNNFSFLDIFFDVAVNPPELTYDGAEICLPYTQAQLDDAGITADQLVIIHYTGEEWELLPTTLQTNPDQACASVTSLSPLALGASDQDGDGLYDTDDKCPQSELSPTIVIDGCDSRVSNPLFEDGCTVSDQIAACAEGARNQGKLVSCVSHLTNGLMKDGIITGREKGAILKCIRGGR